MRNCTCIKRPLFSFYCALPPNQADALAVTAASCPAVNSGTGIMLALLGASINQRWHRWPLAGARTVAMTQPDHIRLAGNQREKRGGNRGRRE